MSIRVIFVPPRCADKKRINPCVSIDGNNNCPAATTASCCSLAGARFLIQQLNLYSRILGLGGWRSRCKPGFRAQVRSITLKDYRDRNHDSGNNPENGRCPTGIQSLEHLSREELQRWVSYYLNDAGRGVEYTRTGNAAPNILRATVLAANAEAAAKRYASTV